MEKPIRYDITIIISPSGESDTQLETKMPGILRENIMTPNYDTGIQMAVKTFEQMIYGDRN